MEDTEKVVIEEVVVLSKFDGDPLPENEVERIHIKDGEIVSIQKIENGEVVSTEPVSTDVEETVKAKEV